MKRLARVALIIASFNFVASLLPSSANSDFSKTGTNLSAAAQISSNGSSVPDLPITFLHASKCVAVTVKEVIYEENGYVTIPWSRYLVPQWTRAWLALGDQHFLFDGQVVRDEHIALLVEFVDEFRRELKEMLKVIGYRFAEQNCTRDHWSQKMNADFVLFDNEDEPQTTQVLTSFDLNYGCHFDASLAIDESHLLLNKSLVNSFLRHVAPAYVGSGGPDPAIRDASAMVTKLPKILYADEIAKWISDDEDGYETETFDDLFLSRFEEDEFIEQIIDYHELSRFLKERFDRITKLLNNIGSAALNHALVYYQPEKTLSNSKQLRSLIPWSSDDPLGDHLIFAANYPRNVFADKDSFLDGFLDDINVHPVEIDGETTKARLLVTTPNLLSPPAGLLLEITSLDNVHFLRDGHYVKMSDSTSAPTRTMIDLRDVKDFSLDRLNDSEYLARLARNNATRVRLDPRRYCRYRYLPGEQRRKLFCNFALEEERHQSFRNSTQGKYIYAQLRCAATILETMDLEPSSGVEEQMVEACNTTAAFDFEMVYKARRFMAYSPTGLLAMTDREFRATRFTGFDTLLLSEAEATGMHCIHVDRNEFIQVTFNDDQTFLSPLEHEERHFSTRSTVQSDGHFRDPSSAVNVKRDRFTVVRRLPVPDLVASLEFSLASHFLRFIFFFIFVQNCILAHYFPLWAIPMFNVVIISWFIDDSLRPNFGIEPFWWIYFALFRAAALLWSFIFPPLPPRREETILRRG